MSWTPHKPRLTLICAKGDLNQVDRTGTRLPRLRDECTSLVMDELNWIID